MTEPTSDTGGQWLRLQRVHAGYDTAAEFARAIRVERYTLSTYETGKSRPSDETVERIASVLGLPLLEVRRNLGLWVPPDATGETEFSIRDVPTRDLMHELERRFTESEHESRKAAGS